MVMGATSPVLHCTESLALLIDPPSGRSPPRMSAMSPATASHLAYSARRSARGSWTLAAASVNAMFSQPGMSSRPGLEVCWARPKNARAASIGVVTWVRLPQPVEGRCWNRPPESASPPVRLVSLDSWMAVAIAICRPRRGTPRSRATWAIVMALRACSAVKVG